MEIHLIKEKAKEIFDENRKQYILITITYFAVTLILTILAALLNATVDHDPNALLWREHSNNLFVSYSFRLIETIMSAFFLLWIYSLTYRHSYLKRINGNSKDKTMEYTLSSSILLGSVLFFMTAPLRVIAEMLYSPDNFTIIIYYILNFFAAITTFVLGFLIIVYFLQSQKGILYSSQKSVSLILRNLGTYIYFNLSFALWFIIPILVLITGMALLASYGITQSMILQLFTVFCTQMMVGLGIYFFPYYNISKFLLCESLINGIEEAGKNITEKNHSVKKKYLLKSPIEEVLRTEATRNAISMNDNEKSKIENEAALNELSLVIPCEYAMRLVDLNWNDILYAIEQGYFLTKDAVEYAKNEISKNKDVFNALYDLAGLDPSIKDFDEVVYEYVYDFSHRVSKKEKVQSKEKIMYVLLSWGYEHRDEYEDPLSFVEKIYENFDSPVAISEFTMNIPDIDDTSITIDEVMDIFYENWNKYLLGQKSN